MIGNNNWLLKYFCLMSICGVITSVVLIAVLSIFTNLNNTSILIIFVIIALTWMIAGWIALLLSNNLKNLPIFTYVIIISIYCLRLPLDYSLYICFIAFPAFLFMCLKPISSKFLPSIDIDDNYESSDFSAHIKRMLEFKHRIYKALNRFTIRLIDKPYPKYVLTCIINGLKAFVIPRQPFSVLSWVCLACLYKFSIIIIISWAFGCTVALFISKSTRIVSFRLHTINIFICSLLSSLIIIKIFGYIDISTIKFDLILFVICAILSGMRVPCFNANSFKICLNKLL